IRPNVHLDPEQAEGQIVQTLGRSSIYAATSQYEPFGLAPLEAALSRCALVASDIPSFRELWDGAAVFFADNDAASLRRPVAPRRGEPPPPRLAAGRRTKPTTTLSSITARSAWWMTTRLSTRGWFGRRPSAHETTAQDRAVLALAGFRLEPRQCPFPARPH